jgi:hypothetical protein
LTGREIDDKGNLVRKTDQVKTLAANVAVGQARKKKENPYLAHRHHAHVAPKDEAAVGVGTEGTATAVVAAVDDRLKTSSRDVRAKRTFNFVEEGE